MSLDIKKRVKDSEIEKAKRNSKIWFILIIIFLIFIIIGLVLFLLYDYKVIFNHKEEKITKTEIKETRHEENEFVKLDVENENIKYLIKLVHDNTLIGGDQVIYSKDSLKSSDMDEAYKFNLAHNIYRGNATLYGNNSNTGMIEILEKDVKNAYEVIFGTGSYKRTDSIQYDCIKLSYDSVNKKYIGEGGTCLEDSNFYTYENIISVLKNTSELKITTSVVFFDKVSDNLCKDINCNEVLVKNDNDYTKEKHFMNYISLNKDKLDKYTYSFKIKDGFYYYEGVEKKS